MSEPKLTVGRVETWRPIDAENVLFRAGLQDDHIRSQRAAGYVRAAMRELVRELNGRLVPAPQSEAKAEPDYTCPKCGKDFRWAEECACPPVYVVSTANARIAELVREREEARKELREIYDAEPVLMAERHKVWTQAKDDGFREGYRKGVAAAKEACAKRLEGARFSHPWRKEPNIMCFGNVEAARIVRETEVPDA